MRAVLTACWQRRWFRRLAWTFATLLTLVMLLYVWVNWQGAHRLKTAHASLVRNGETFDLRQIASAPVPEAENFCAIPVLKNLALPERVSARATKGRGAFLYKNLPIESESEAKGAAENRKRLELLGFPVSDQPKLINSRPRQGVNFSMGDATDLKAWAEWLRKGSLPMPADSGNAGRDVLAGLSAHDALVAELAAGLDRTEAQWTPSWRTREMPETIYSILVPHYQALGTAGPYFALRATAAAAAGEASKAHESLLILLRLSRATLDDPSILGALVGSIQTTLACDATWELARAHAGTTEDFRRLEIELRRLDLRASLLRGFRYETVGGAETMQWLKRLPKADVLAFSDAMGFTDEKGIHHSTYLSALAWLLPPGWYDMSAAAILECNYDFTIAPLRDHGFAACIARVPELEQRLKSERAYPFLHLDSVFAMVDLAGTSKLCPRLAYAQDIVNQAVIACALERYYAAHQSYPDRLASLDLEGRPLPLDIFSGKPPHYRKTSNGRYALWSVGLDGEDDGGKRVLDPARPEKTRFYDPNYTGDWVWDFLPHNP